jgi:hypothetical protein
MGNLEKRANFSARRDEDLARYVEMLLASVDEIRYVIDVDQDLLDGLTDMAEEYQDSLVSVHFYRAQAASAAERKDRARRALEDQLLPFVESLRDALAPAVERPAALVA